MAYSPTYDASKDSGTSVKFNSDLNPEDSYDVDLRALDPVERKTARLGDAAGEAKQNRVEKSLKAARSAGKFRKKRMYDQPFTDRSGGMNEGFTRGDNFPYAGSTNYADKPEANFGTFRGF